MLYCFKQEIFELVSESAVYIKENLVLSKILRVNFTYVNQQKLTMPNSFDG